MSKCFRVKRYRFRSVTKRFPIIFCYVIAPQMRSLTGDFSGEFTQRVCVCSVLTNKRVSQEFHANQRTALSCSLVSEFPTWAHRNTFVSRSLANWRQRRRTIHGPELLTIYDCLRVSGGNDASPTALEFRESFYRNDGCNGVDGWIENCYFHFKAPVSSP